MDRPPLTYQKALAVLKSLGEPPEAVPAPSKLPSHCCTPSQLLKAHEYDIPSLDDLGVDVSQCGPCLYPGGETEGRARLEKCLQRKVRKL